MDELTPQHLQAIGTTAIDALTAESLRLRAVKAELLEALEHVRTTLDNIIGDRELLETYLPLLLKDVRAAIEAARGDA